MARSTREPLTRTQERFWEFVQSRRQLLAERITQTTQLLTGRPA
jgi:hypothetical protein